MREIKLRVWDKTRKRLFEVTQLKINPINGQYQAYFVFKKKFNMVNGTDDIRSISYDESVLMQYTGVQDKNGLEIYEDDIVLFSECEKFIVKGKYELDTVGGSEPPYYDTMIERPSCFEVIGNIHENPELLNN